jgi:glycosyltransferase involved in cell wall biosynthesis
MRILLKCPTRSRPQKVIQTLATYMKLANNTKDIGVAVSCDDNDQSMLRNLVQEEIVRTLLPAGWSKLFFSPNTNKIQACNANMNEIEWQWDIVVLVSDDMIPQLKGWDDVIRNHMIARFPDTNGILWFNDGHQGDKLNTLCVFGRAMYESFGYIYHPDYKSLFCDTELTDLCKGKLADKCLYVPYCIIRHEHPGTGYAQNMDALYAHNQRFWSEDMYTYIRRKNYTYDWSVLIPTIPGRETKLHTLIMSIREKVARICPDLRVEICLSFDNRETSIGLKRQTLLNQAKGKYLSFIDDDDTITDAYVEDVWACFQGGYHTMRLRGQMKEYTFTHSVAVKLNDPMATKDDPPVFQRPPNHLNPMFSDIAKFIPFKDALRGEDLDWTLTLLKSNFLETEYTSDPSRIHYNYDLGPRNIHRDTATLQQQMTYEEMLKMVFTPQGAVQSTVETKRESGLKLGPRGFVSK